MMMMMMMNVCIAEIIGTAQH